MANIPKVKAGDYKQRLRKAQRLADGEQMSVVNGMRTFKKVETTQREQGTADRIIYPRAKLITDYLDLMVGLT